MINIQETEINAKKFVTSTSRYVGSKVYFYGDQNFITFETYKRKNYNRLGNEKVMLIGKGVEYRPDLVAYDFYGFVDAWWNILEANGMSDIFDFKAGKTIILPEVV